MRVMVGGRAMNGKSRAAELAAVVARQFGQKLSLKLIATGRRRGYDPRGPFRALCHGRGDGHATASSSPATGRCTARVPKTRARSRRSCRGDPDDQRGLRGLPAVLCICPQVGGLLRAAELPIALGAQDVERRGCRAPITGEVSAAMLEDLRLPVRDRRPLRAAPGPGRR